MDTSPYLVTTPATLAPPSGGGVSVASLIHLVTSAHDAGPAEAAAERVAAALAAAPAVELPFAYRRHGASKYARHLIHRDVERDLVVIAMVWSPGQGTPVHDHGGYWCIEQVLAGRLDSDIYHAREQGADGAFRLELVARETQEQGAIALCGRRSRCTRSATPARRPP